MCGWTWSTACSSRGPGSSSIFSARSVPHSHLRGRRLAHLLVLLGLMADRRAGGERRRTAALAGQADVPARLRPPVAAGGLGADQALARRWPAISPVDTLREAGAVTWSRSTDGSLHVRRAGVFLLIGYPVAFSLAAVGLFFGFFGDRDRLFDRASSARSRCGSSASCRTSCCWRSRSSPSWARSSSAAASPRTCSRASASCSGRCAAASPMP